MKYGYNSHFLKKLHLIVIKANKIFKFPDIWKEILICTQKLAVLTMNIIVHEV